MARGSDDGKKGNCGAFVNCVDGGGDGAKIKSKQETMRGPIKCAERIAEEDRQSFQPQPYTCANSTKGRQ